MADDEIVTRVMVYIECDACGHREEIQDGEEAAKRAARRHAEHCRSCHKGTHR